MATVVFITAGATYTIPSDFVSLISVEALGAGGNGSTAASNTSGGGGGGSGAYAKQTIVSGLSPGAIINIQIGTAGGTAGSGTAPTSNTWFKDSSTLVAAGGTTPTGAAGGTSGQAANCVGSTTTGGGTGGASAANFGGGGGAGSAGLTGVGRSGGASSTTAAAGGGGGGGSNGGSSNNGSAATTTAGALGGKGTSGSGSGSGGVANGGTAATDGTVGGGGGGGGGNTVASGAVGGGGANGSKDSSWDATHGASGGGGGGGSGDRTTTNGGNGGNGGTYGGGGGGYGSNGGAGIGVKGTSGTGGQGIIVFTYEAPATSLLTDWTKFSEPVRTLPGLASRHQQISAEPPYSFISTVPRFGWRPPLSEPVRVKLGERPENQQFLAYTEAKTQNSPNNNFAEQTQYDKYAYPWSEPVRLKPGIIYDLQHYFEMEPLPPDPGMEVPWFAPFADPSAFLVKRGLRAYLQRFLELDPAPPSDILDREIPWYNWLSNPSVMTRPMLRTGNQPVLAISPYIPSYYPFDKGYVIE